jgi:cytochrome c oxidase cbb3-type subunit III
MSNDKDKPEVDEATGTQTTGHEWDGIKELNTPLPRWWLIIMYATIVWSVVYWVFMPSWPGINGYLKGTRNHSERANVDKAMAELQAMRSANSEKLLASKSLTDIENDPELLQFAMASGKAAFGDNCETCHGPGGQGAVGYPNLNDDVWLWGGTLDDIRTTIAYGIRTPHPKSRKSMMPAFGKTGILSGEQVNDLTSYVQYLAGEEDVNGEAVQRATPLFKAQCSVCHNADGTGKRMFGAPNLTDREWLYGGDREAIKYTITNSRNGVMPSWDHRFDEATIASLAVYVHTLGGGEQE